MMCFGIVPITSARYGMAGCTGLAIFDIQAKKNIENSSLS
jgi:hypothetical protein